MINSNGLGLERITKVAGIKLTEVNKPEIITQVETLKQDLSATILTKERALAQAIEVLSISEEVDAIEADFNQKKIRLPSVFSIFTAGLKPPAEKSVTLAKYGDEPFTGLFPAGIPGHECKASVLELSNHNTMAVFEGRSLHVYEGNDLRQAPIVSSHGLRLIKEMVRRQRARRIDAAVILTFLTGADYETGHTKVGEMAIFMDDTELNNVNHSGAGAHDLLDKYDGNRIIGKAGKSTDPEMTRDFIAIAKKRGLIVHPAVTVGTPGAPEFQSVFERVLAKMAFDNALKTKLLKAIIEPVFGRGWQRTASLLFNMSVTPELAVFRQLKPGEPPIRVLSLGLVTDLVGNKDSLTIDHGVVFSRALEEAGKYIPAIVDIATQASVKPSKISNDFSIRAQLVSEGVIK
jgi:hypothetical protein